MRLLAAVLAAVAVWPVATQADGRVDLGYTVHIAYAALKGILRADGPLGSWQR